MNYVLYVIRQYVKKGRVKIGFTGDLKKRLKSIQTGNPAHCRVIGVMKAKSLAHARSVEALLHEKCEKSRLTGEWFTRGAIGVLRGTEYPFEWISEVDEIINKQIPDIKNKKHQPDGLKTLLSLTKGLPLDRDGRVSDKGKNKKRQQPKKALAILINELKHHHGDGHFMSIRDFCGRAKPPPLPSHIYKGERGAIAEWRAKKNKPKRDCSVEFTKSDMVLFSCKTKFLELFETEMHPAFALRCVIAVAGKDY